MVSRLWLLFLLGSALCSSWAVAGTGLTVKVDRKSGVLGEPLQVEIHALDAHAPLNSLNLETLKQEFNVYSISSSAQTHRIKGRSVSSETMTLILYPLRAGKLHLPAFSLRGKSSKPLEIRITETAPHSPRVIFKTALDIEHLQVRQSATLTLDIYDDGSLQWIAPRELFVKDAHVQKLAESQREEEMAGIRYTVHRYAWALMPLREGSIKVEFPMLEAMKFGTRLRYALVPLLGNAAAVPAYLPVHVPVGELLLTPQDLPNEIALKRPLNWRFNVQGNGVSAEGLRKLLTVIQGNEAVFFYPPQISQSDNVRPLTATQTLLVTIPFVPLHTGTLQLPEINLPYYDPARARIESARLPASHVEVFNPLWYSVMRLALALLLSVGMFVAGYKLFKKLMWTLQRNKVLMQIHLAADLAQLQRALLQFGGEHSTARHLTLQQWLQQIQRCYLMDTWVFESVQKLQRMQYGDAGENVDIVPFAQEFAGRLKNLKQRR